MELHRREVFIEVSAGYWARPEECYTVQPSACGLPMAKDSCECGPTPNYKTCSNHHEIFWGGVSAASSSSS